MSIKIKAAVMCVVLTGCILGAYFYDSAPETVIVAQPQQTLSEETERVSDLDFARPFQSQPVTVPTPVNSSVEQPEEEPWSVQQERHRQRINELLVQRQNVVVDSDEYYQIEDEINDQIEQMGLTEYHAGGWGVAMFPPNASIILDVAKDLDPSQSQVYAQELATLEVVRTQREEIDAEKSRNAEKGVKDSPELTERDQRLVAREFKLVKDYPEFFKELDVLLARRHEALN